MLSGVVSGANTDQIDYNRYDLDAPVADMMWCGTSNEVILVLTDAGTVYRSRDRGASWKKLQQVMTQVGGQVADEDQEVSTLVVYNYKLAALMLLISFHLMWYT